MNFLSDNHKLIPVFILLSIFPLASCQEQASNTAIYSGVPWFDDGGNTVNAHGANIIKDNNRFYLFGESKTDTSNAFSGFSCYSSTDLYNWKFENMVLPVQDSGRLGPGRVGERVKVLKCPKTGMYIMFMHTDDLSYRDQCVGYATSDKVNGTYTFRGPLLFKGSAIKKWDMGVFRDTDGSGYLVTHSGNLYRLSDDYTSVEEQVTTDMTPHCEAPAIFKKNGTYFWLGSGLTSWERNDNYYFTATSLSGPWTERGIFAPKGTLTWNSQSTYVLTIAGSTDTCYMFMGDRWSYPRQASAATYVWQPLLVSGNSLSLPDYKEGWKVNPGSGTWSPSAIGVKTIDNTDTKAIEYSGKWIQPSPGDILTDSRSDSNGSSLTVKFKGTQIGLCGVAGPDRGYGQVILKNSKEKIILSAIIDMYCLYPEASLKFLSPVLPKGRYTLTLSVMGEHGNWSNKKGRVFGSTGNFISLDKIIIEN